MPEIKVPPARAGTHHDELRALIGAALELFVKPKSMTINGIKLGFQKVAKDRMGRCRPGRSPDQRSIFQNRPTC